MPAHGRRFRRQGNAGGDTRRARRARGASTPAGRCACASIAIRTWRSPAIGIRSSRAFKVGFDRDGRVARGAGSISGRTAAGRWILSQAVTDRALFHLDNAYYIPAVEFRGQVAKTNVSSNTAFRGFGGPQGMLVIEEILDRIARRAWSAAGSRARTKSLSRHRRDEHDALRPGHRGQPHPDDLARVEESRRASNGAAGRLRRGTPPIRITKRGLAITPVKFGISFTSRTSIRPARSC